MPLLVVDLLKPAKGQLSEKQGRHFFQQLIDAISYCHDMGVYHRDLKVQLHDYGISNYTLAHDYKMQATRILHLLDYDS